MKKIIIVLGKAFLNFIYFFIKLFPTKNQIIYTSMQSNNISLDFELLRNKITKHDNSIKQIFLCKKMKSGLKKKSDYVVYVFSMVGYVFKAMYYLATSKVCITESYCVPVSILKHKKNLKIVQVWHASGAVKKFGYQILDKEEGKSSEIANLMCMHKNYNYAIAPSKVTKEIFSEAFNMEKEKIVKLGLPRLEYISNTKYDKSSEIYNSYPELKEKKIILYVPTFRKDKSIDLSEIFNYQYDKTKYKIIIKLHPLDDTQIPSEYTFDNKYTSYDLIKIADYIITDYSTLSIEASVLNKPIFLYLYDMENYNQSRGLNIDLCNELKTFTSKNFSDIMNKIKNHDYNMNEIEKYKNKYIEVNPKNTTAKLADFVLKLM